MYRFVALCATLLFVQLCELEARGSTGGDLKTEAAGIPPWVKSPLFHSPEIFVADYREMMKSFKIFIYPYPESSPHFGYTRSTERLPGGNYASEAYFFRNIQESVFSTENADEASLFLLPFSVLKLRHSVGPLSVPGFVKGYVESTVMKKWSYWNRTRGADHLYATCHDIGVDAVRESWEVKKNSIQVICPADVWKRDFVPHKDMAFPQIWPRIGLKPGGKPPGERKVLAFWSGSQNSRTRALLKATWENDSEIVIGGGAMHKSIRGENYFDSFRNTRFCMHVKGFQVHTARVGDSIFFGCVPVIIANQYDLPFKGIVDWREFSVLVAEEDIPNLKNILKSISKSRYETLYRNVEIVRRFFTWNSPPEEYDLFHMVMYELWQRRFVVRPMLDM